MYTNTHTHTHTHTTIVTSFTCPPATVGLIFASVLVCLIQTKLQMLHPATYYTDFTRAFFTFKMHDFAVQALGVI
jgi:hypothetical protein